MTSVATKEKAKMPPEEAVRAVATPVAKFNAVDRHRPAGGAAHAIEGETLPRRPCLRVGLACRAREASALTQGWRSIGYLPLGRSNP